MIKKKMMRKQIFTVPTQNACYTNFHLLRGSRCDKSENFKKGAGSPGQVVVQISNSCLRLCQVSMPASQTANASPPLEKKNIIANALGSDDFLDEIDNILDDEENEENHFHFCKCCYNIPSWLQFLLYAFFGSLVLLVPLIVIVWLDPRHNFLDASSQMNGWTYPYIARWSLYLTLCWITELIVWRLIGAFPRIITALALLITKKTNERLEIIAEFIVALRLWATWAVWMIIVQALYTVFFKNNVPVGVLPTDPSVEGQYERLWSIISTIMVFSICVFFQKFFMHSIAVNFHRSAYTDRIERSKKSLKFIDKLRQVVKRFNVKISPTLGFGVKKTNDQQIKSGENATQLSIDMDKLPENNLPASNTSPKIGKWKSVSTFASPKFSMPNFNMDGA